MNRRRPKQIVIRASEEEFSKIKKKVEKSKLNQNEYLLKCCLNKKITVVEGLDELTMELKNISNELNEIRINNNMSNSENEYDKVNEELKEIWQLLRQLIQKIH